MCTFILFYFIADTAMHINTAMFEQNSRSGYVLKPAVMRDKSHPMFNRFNPAEKDIEGLQPSTLTVHVCIRHVNIDFKADFF